MCLSLTLSPAWPHSPPLNSTLLLIIFFVFQQGSIWLYPVPCSTVKGGLKQPRACCSSQQTQVTRSIEHAVIPNTYTDTSTQTESVNNTQPPALQLCLLTAARPPQSSSEVKICYIMQPSIDFPPLARCQLPAPKSKLSRFVPWGDSYSLLDGVAELDTQTETERKGKQEQKKKWKATQAS